MIEFVVGTVVGLISFLAGHRIGKEVKKDE